MRCTFLLLAVPLAITIANPIENPQDVGANPVAGEDFSHINLAYDDAPYKIATDITQDQGEDSGNMISIANSGLEPFDGDQETTDQLPDIRNVLLANTPDVVTSLAPGVAVPALKRTCEDQGFFAVYNISSGMSHKRFYSAIATSVVQYA